MTWQQRAVRVAFYLWVSLLNLVGMATLWARASDVFTPEAGTRLFGVLGQLVASLLAAGAARLPVVVVGGVSLVPMLLSVCCLEAAGQLMSRVQLTAAAEDLARQRRQEPADPSTGLTPWASLLQGIRVIRGSGYLQRICVYVVFNYFVSSFFYFEKTIIVARVPDAGVRTTWFAMINSASASFILVLQLAVTGRVMRALGALAANNKPYLDHGIEVAYRFAGFDPFARSQYFGISLDLGQFERYRRIFYTPLYRLSLRRRVGGRFDGAWFTESLIAEGSSRQTLYGVI
ncbi:hypothetical protein F751_1787 [Auxenochlorella protothecoides]|uniref:Uncharacterized protein n=1 Tax=Auxenochlorella protothecoides TaxID=3075 RepID=A0A087SGQ4_AUXPR|nr:hypothetical protein F751_1787 [Auxenochlorella protothecoides]KFM24908.1 hypothetical protein F751_1787 [Auxenochlorella protothecoides]